MDPMDKPTQDPVFVVAAPCAGTGLLVKLLVAADNVRKLTAGERVAALKVFEGDPTLAPASAAAVETSLRMIYAGPERFVSASPHHALSIPRLRVAFPKACFIYLYRDPGEQMAQALHLAASGKAADASDSRGWAARARENPGSIQNLDPSDIVALKWSFYTAQIINDLALLPAEVRCAVTYNELLDDPLRVCAQLGEFAGLSFAPSPQAMAGYRRHLGRQRTWPAHTPPPWVDLLMEQARAFADESHPSASCAQAAKASRPSRLRLSLGWGEAGPAPFASGLQP